MSSGEGTPATPEQPFEGLARLHDHLFEADASMVRVPSGAIGGAPPESLAGIHLVRETALGALVDLRRGRPDRAAAALERVLDQQYPLSEVAWAGTFRTTAQDPEPPADGAAYVHYDPNWRQFLGAILAFALDHHDADLPSGLTDRMTTAVERCVRGEPESRLEDWYTNPSLLHAWLTAWVGARLGDRTLLAAGEARRARMVARIEAAGDVDEYNSPTYDGIDLLAAGLWAAHPPTSGFEASAEVVASAVGRRLSTLFHPGLGAICGPHVRAYGVDLRAYVSLAALWLTLAGADAAAILPSAIDERTSHVHDLYLLPLFESVADLVVPHLELRPVDRARHHERHDGDARASSLLERRLALGAESGRRPTFSRNQYVPVTAHAADGPDDSNVVAVAIKAATADDAVDAHLGEPSTVAADVTSAGPASVVVLTSHSPEITATSLRIGPVDIALDRAPAAAEQRNLPSGTELHLTWDGPRVRLDVTVR
ncbi:MAG: hypothetical protein S0880_01230 [Actinomycetota bacterium]|nr:hypothetical protein [Actinomycetota bacterium]